MTDNYNDDDFDSEDIDTDEASDSPRGLRRAANKSKKLESELQAAKRELAFLKAGINPEDPKMRYFVKGYEGDLSAEAVREAALEAGFLASQQGTDPQQQAIASAEQRVVSASAGAIYEDASEEAALARLEQAMEEGGVDAMMEVARQYGIPIATEQ
jgi:hypothetical protein